MPSKFPILVDVSKHVSPQEKWDKVIQQHKSIIVTKLKERLENHADKYLAQRTHPIDFEVFGVGKFEVQVTIERRYAEESSYPNLRKVCDPAYVDQFPSPCFWYIVHVVQEPKLWKQ